MHFKDLELFTKDIKKFKNLLVKIENARCLIINKEIERINIIRRKNKLKEIPTYKPDLETLEDQVVRSMDYMLKHIDIKETKDDHFIGAFLVSVKSLLDEVSCDIHAKEYTYNRDYIPDLAQSLDALNDIEIKFLIQINFTLPPAEIIYLSDNPPADAAGRYKTKKFEELVPKLTKSLSAFFKSTGEAAKAEQKANQNYNIAWVIANKL